MINIKLNNWDKYNKRQKDIKRPYWFAMSNEIFSDAFYFDLSEKERQAFIYILCEASKQNRYGSVELSENLFSQVTGYSSGVLSSVCDKLLKSGRAAGWRRDGGGGATATVQNSTEHDSTEHNTLDHFKNDRVCFDFESLYKKYPRKVGKTEGLLRAKAMIKTDEDYQLLSLAIDNYISYLKKTGTMAQYVKHFSTFIGSGAKQSWRDWLDEDAGNSEKLKKEHDYSFLKE